MRTPLKPSDCRLLLDRIAAQLLSFQAGDFELRSAAHELYSLLSDITGVGDSWGTPENNRETLLDCGKAISPNDAARSILDYHRTAQFTRGIYAAIKEAQRRFSRRPIEILYAGCGPFAPFAIIIATHFSPDEIQFTLVDIHARSLSAVKQLTHFLGLDDFVRRYVQGNAARYQHPGDNELHLVITETMQRTLAIEPQVAIDINLRPQLAPGGIFIPESIAIEVCLSDINKELPSATQEIGFPGSDSGNLKTERSRISLGRIFELTYPSTRDAPSTSAMASPSRKALFAPITIEIPSDVDETFYLVLLTNLTIFDTIGLSEYTSGLTVPTILHDLGSFAGGSRIEFCYTLGDQPGFRYRLLPN